MSKSRIRYTSFPLTKAPPAFVDRVVAIFRKHEAAIGTDELEKGLTSDMVLSALSIDLMELGFQIENGKTATGKIDRPVFFGENGVPERRYQIDGYNAEWRCGLEVEAGRAWMGNAIYRDIIQASVMVDVDHLILAVSNKYKYKSGGRDIVSADYENTVSVVATLYGHDRVKLPYGLTVIGY